MSFSPETEKKIRQFASQQSQFYLDDAEMTYLEKLRQKGNQTREKVAKQLRRFQSTSEHSREARDDMLLYMNDYMNDLVANGMDEAGAFEKAKQELAFDSDSDRTTELQDRFARYYEDMPPHVYEAVGLYYGAGIFIGAVLGGLCGLGMGYAVFPHIRWIVTGIGLAAGFLLGLGFGMLKHAAIVQKINR